MSRRLKDESKWPPEDGKAYIHSEEFGRVLVRLAKELAARYSAMDFTDAVARVFAWFDAKLKENRRFINEQRFPSDEAFHAYVKQAVWNVGRMAQRSRERERKGTVSELPREQQVVAWGSNPEDQVTLLDVLQSLPDPHRTVLEKLLVEGDSVSSIGRQLQLEKRAVERIYEEAADMVAKRLSSDSGS